MRDIYDSNGKYKTTKDAGINNLTNTIKWSNTTPSKSVNENNKKVRDYSVWEFADLIYQTAVEHPLKSNFWFSKFKEFKKQVEQEWSNISPEYSIIIKTTENIMKSSEFSDNTGKIETYIRNTFWQKKTIEEFQRNMKDFIRRSASQKKVLTMNDFDIGYNENRKLTEYEQKQLHTYIVTINTQVNALSSKSEKITFIESTIKLNRSIHFENISYLKSIIEILDSKLIATNQGHSWSMFDTFVDKTKAITGEWNTDKNREIATNLAMKATVDKGIGHFISWNKAKNNYDIVSIQEISEKLKNNMNIDAALFRSLITDNKNWQDLITKGMNDPYAISAVWAYISKKPDTVLFSGNEPAKSFFIQAYTATVDIQTSILNNKIQALKWDFNTLFPKIANNPKITPIMKDLLRWGKVWEFYSILAWTETNSTIRGIMEAIEIDAKNIKEISIKLANESSKELKDKKVKDLVDQYNIIQKEDQARLSTIKDKQVTTALGPEEMSFLLRIAKPGSKLEEYLRSRNDVKQSSRIEWSAHQWWIEASKWPKDQKPKSTPESRKRIEGYGNLKSQLTDSQVSATIGKQNIEWYTQFENPEARMKEYRRLNGLTTRTEKEQARLDWIEQEINQAKRTAIEVSSFSRTPGVTKDTVRELIRSTTNSKLSNKALDQWIDTQSFISKYVEEKNFVDVVEKKAAYMNVWDSKSIGDLYEMGKIDISHMSSESGSVSLWDTNIMWNNSFAGMNELMNCRLVVWNNNLTRTIVTPGLKIIAANIPLENIDSTIHQLWRFFTLWLWVLAPYMKQISESIKKGRPDSITWLDWDYDIGEDTRFLKILAVSLYWEENLPKEQNIPNLIQMFNRVDRKQQPKYILKQKWILTDSWTIILGLLDTELKAASKKIT